VTQTAHPISNAGPLSPAARFLWAALIFATLYLCYFHNLGAIGLVGPDEPRYAWIARDMAESGDWVTPRLYGQPWFEKPVLYYWGAAACFKIFGVSEATARLPSAICALLATLALAWLAWRIYGAGTARWLLLLLPTSVGMIGFSHAAATDMPFAAMLTIAMVFATGIVGLVPSAGFAIYTPISSLYSNTRPAGVGSLFLFGFFLGLATLAKGPAAIILSGGAVLLWAAFTKRWRDAFRCLHPLAIAGFCLTALPWYILCARRNPDFFRIFIIEHNFKRFLTPEFQHIQPFWFYGPILLAATLPWIVPFLAAIISMAATSLRTRSISPQTIFLACWGIFPIVFFSISQSKLPGYILPAIPALFLAPAVLLSSNDDRRLRTTRISLLLSAFLAAACAVTFDLVGRRLLGKYEELQPVVISFSLVILVTFLSLLLSKALRYRSLQIALRTFGFLSFLFLVYLGGSEEALRHVLLVDPSARSLARSVVTYGGSATNLHLVGVRRATRYQLNFYLRSDLPEWNGQLEPGELLLGEGISCKGLNLDNVDNVCKDLWGEIDKTDDWELLQIGPSPAQ
jgi:4-amino-4-deoxy-L-arabinose transferase-like glycosyltransferase